jgi:large subunit ribosomal protein L25
MELTIECQPREANSKPNALRRNGKIPAVLYGHKGSESIELTVNAKAAEFLVRDAKVGKTPIQVSVPALSWQGTAVLQEVQTHPWKSTNLYHLSFFASK